ncbi:MAG: hypothetical protein EOM20_20410 [Spartobacteria bacterium]|nr:hypothetical protein [Spartobacteria bacterium]
MNRPSPTDTFTGGYPFLERLARLPRGLQRVIAAVFCEAVFWGTRGLRHALLSNLAMVHPQWPRYRRVLLARRIMLNYGIYFQDLMRVTTAEEVLAPEQFFDDLQGFEHIQTALDSAHGGLLVTPHLGNWELGTLVMAPYRDRLAAVTAPIKSPAMQEKMRCFRARYGVELVTLENPAEYLFTLKRLLAERKLVTMLVDRYVGGHAMTVPFFGHDTTLPCGYLYLARMYDAPVVPCVVLRKPDGRYGCYARPPVFVEQTDDREADIRRALTTVAGVMQQDIERHITQWYCFKPLWTPPAHSL